MKTWRMAMGWVCALAATPATALGPQVSVGLWLNLDATQENTLALEIPAALGGGVRTTRLVGGAHAVVTFDLLSMLTLQGLVVGVTIDEIRIAGESFDLFPGAPSGTVCVVGDDAGAGSGLMFLPLLGAPRVAASFETRTHLRGPLGAFLPDGIPLSARVEDELQVDLLSLFRSNFQGGPAVVETSATGTVPPEVVFLGGSEFALDVTLFNSFTPPGDPLLQECASFQP